MTDFTRREWNSVVLAGLLPLWSARTLGLPTNAGQSSQSATYKGVIIGTQSYSFRDRPLDAAIDGMKQAGLTSCELWQGHVEPKDVARNDVRRWRETVSLDEIRAIRDKFDRVGIRLSAYNISFRDDFSDQEIDRGFQMAKALGVTVITASSNVSTVGRVAAAAVRHKIPVGMHNHSKIDANEFATPDSLTNAVKAGHGFIAINLDIGHFTAADFDAVQFLHQHHDRIVSLHIKDRKRDQGSNVPFGQGDTPIGPVLRMLRDQHWNIPANIEYEYDGADTIDEVKRCFEFCRRELDS